MTRILVVETSITVGKVIELSLRDADITTVTSIADAKIKLATVRPDVIIAAAVLPDGAGHELCRRGVPVILLRGTFEKFDEAKARAAGADEILAKPFKPDDLVRAVERAAGR